VTYDPVAHWQERGARYEREFRRKPAFDAQEAAILDVLDGLSFRSILEVGCGFGRVTRLVAERWPDVPITALDLSTEQLASLQSAVPRVQTVESTIQGFTSRRKWDLVLAVEVLMHVPPDQIEKVVGKLRRLARTNLVSVDWAVPYGDTRELGGTDFCHDYAALYGDADVVELGAQRLYRVTI
jgi:trans-aconitate methyltransferase